MTPPPLSLWQPWLTWFPESLQADLSEVLKQLAGFLAPILATRQQVSEDDAGLSRLHTRGHYQHLLASEWLLAEAYPDEFIRRVIHHEHLFLTSEPESTQHGHQIVVLLDCGLGQLGAPRLVHIALLLLLAKRAHMQGQTLRWGVLQNYPKLYDWLSVDDLMKLLQQRQTATVTEQQWLIWSKQLARQSSVFDECWVVSDLGHGDVPVAMGETHWLQIHRAIVVANALALDVQRPAVGNRRHILHLPEPSVIKRLLQGAWLESQAEAPVAQLNQPIDLTTPVIVSNTGQLVLLRLRSLADAKKSAYCLVNLSTKGQHSKRQHRYWEVPSWPSGMACMGRHGFVLGTQEDGGERCWYASHKAKQLPVRLLGSATCMPTSSVLSPLLAVQRKNMFFVYLLDEARVLWSWCFVADADKGASLDAKQSLVAHNVVGMASLNQYAMLYLTQTQQGKLTIQYSGYSEKTHVLGSAMPIQKTYFCGTESQWLYRFGVCAVAETAQRWLIYVDVGNGQDVQVVSELVNVPDGWTVLGVSVDGSGQDVGLIVLDNAQQQVAIYTGGVLTVRLQRSEPWRQVIHHSSTRLLTCLTETELSVYRLPNMTLLYHLKGGVAK